ncbi:hypothetical protein FACS1894133_2400 [Clostridia bacterium]|nr:hypothetical protein FACS1894133_2400 [Clostridia bacterium]
MRKQKNGVDKPFERADELSVKSARLEELNKIFCTADVVIADDGESDGKAETNGKVADKTNNKAEKLNGALPNTIPKSDNTIAVKPLTM